MLWLSSPACADEESSSCSLRRWLTFVGEKRKKCLHPSSWRACYWKDRISSGDHSTLTSQRWDRLTETQHRMMKHGLFLRLILGVRRHQEAREACFFFFGFFFIISWGMDTAGRHAGLQEKWGCGGGRLKLKTLELKHWDLTPRDVECWNIQSNWSKEGWLHESDDTDGSRAPHSEHSHCF